MNRDPLEENGGVNLYSSFNNNPIDYYDLYGKWATRASKYLFFGWFSLGLLDETHESITEKAFEMSKKSLIGIIGDDAKTYIRNQIIKGNRKQDFKYTSIDHRHYLTGSKINSGARSDSGFEYGLYLIEEKRNFDFFIKRADIAKSIRWQGFHCEKALESLGLLSHSWQDYYGHGLGPRRLAAPYGEYNVRDTDVLFYNPYNRKLQPASWSLLGGKEHPGFGQEPVKYGSPVSFNYKIRVQQSKNFTSKQYKLYLEKWSYYECRCYINTRFSLFWRFMRFLKDRTVARFL